MNTDNKSRDIISNMCDSTSALLTNLKMISKFEIAGTDLTESTTFESVTDQNSHLFLSSPADILRRSLGQLPEDLQPENYSDLISGLYPHKYKDDYSEMRPFVQTAFDHAHKISSEYYRAKERFGFSS